LDDAVTPPARRLAGLAPAFAVGLAFTTCAALSWRKLGSLLIDGGRELDVPYQLLQGRLLYRDVDYYWGPLAPYLNAALYRLVGVSVDTVMWAGLAVAFLATAALHRITARTSGRWPAAAVAVTFVLASAFARPGDIAIFNFVLPFNCNATYGMAAGLWSLAFLLDHVESGQVRPFVASALLLALTALAKLEVLLPTLGAHLLFGLARRRELGARHLAGWSLALTLAVVPYAMLASAQPSLWSESLTRPVNAAAAVYLRRTLGLADPAGAVLAMAWSGLSFAGVLTIGWAAAGLARRLPARRAAAVIGLAFVAVLAVELAIPPDVGLRAAPLALSAGLAMLVGGWRREPDGRTRLLGLALLSVFALLSLARVPLRAMASHYGFFLLPPSLPALVALAAFRGDAWRRRASLAVASALLLGFGLSSYATTATWLALPHVPLVTSRGTLLVREGAPERPLLEVLSRFPPETRVVAVTEGIGLVFAAGLREGDRRVSYLPMTLPDSESDRRLAAAWRLKPPDLVLLWQGRDLWPEFGSRGFGVDYAREAGAFLASHYTVRPELEGDFVLLQRAR
jgi:hypothetical protein